MKIVVIGPGALGCLLAASLATSSEHELWLLDRDVRRANRLAQDGLLFLQGDMQGRFHINASANAHHIGPADLLFLCVKSHQVKKAVVGSLPLFSDSSLLISFQNGISHLHILKETIPNLNWAAGVTTMGATLVAPGHVRHGGKGLTKIGFLDSNIDKLPHALHNAAKLLTEAGIATVCVDDIVDQIWAKFLVNIGINALTAIHGCPNGELLHSKQILDTMKKAVLEAAAVARAKGINHPPDPVATTIKICQATAHNHSSMLQDVLNKRNTEVEAINGALVAEAHHLNIPVPANEQLFRKVKELEKEYLA